MKPSISAPSPLPLQRDKDSNASRSDNDLLEVNSEDSVETIGKCTNTSIGTSNYIRTDSPINLSKLRVHNLNKNKQNLRRFNQLSPSLQYSLSANTQYRSSQIHSEQLVWRHPGGVVSLLEILGRTLRSTEEQLIDIGNIASLTEFVQKVCHKCLLAKTPLLRKKTFEIMSLLLLLNRTKSFGSYPLWLVHTSLLYHSVDQFSFYWIIFPKYHRGQLVALHQME